MDAKASYAITLVGVLIGFMLSNDDHTLDVGGFFEKALRHLRDGVFNWSIFVLVDYDYYYQGNIINTSMEDWYKEHCK